MMNRKLVRSSALLFSLLALGSASPAYATTLNTVNLDRLRAAPGQDGIGLGALVIPTYTELGEFTINLYNDQQVALYWASGSMSLYMPATFMPIGRKKFGGFSGTLRELAGSAGSQPLFVGQLEGTWQMDGNGVGTMHGIAYRPDGDGVLQPFAVINGKFEALQVVLPEPGAIMGSVGFGSGSGGGGFTYSYLTSMGQAMAAIPNQGGVISAIRQGGALNGMDPFGVPNQALELRIREARAQAKVNLNSSGQSQPGSLAPVSPGPTGSVPVQPHLAGKILAMYKVVY